MDSFGGFGGSGFDCGGYDYGGGYSYQPSHTAFEPDHFAEPAFDESFIAPAAQAAAGYDESHDVNYDARADVQVEFAAGATFDPTAFNAAIGYANLGTAAGAEAQAELERCMAEAIAEQESYLAAEAAEAAAIQANSERGFFTKLGNLFGRKS